MNDFSLIVLSFRCYAIHKYIPRFWGAQYNVRYIPRDQEAGARGLGLGAWGLGLGAVFSSMAMFS